MIPGELLAEPGELELNAGRPTITLVVANTGDRPIQVGSHYHFFETNAGAELRPRSGARLPPRHRRRHRRALRAGPDAHGELVALAGDRKVYGFRGLIQGAL
jgi:urease subunit beta